jgi:hypothetical protein
MFHVTVIDTDNLVSSFDYAECPSLEMLKAWVEGHIESVPHWYKFDGKDCVVFCNEEGKWDKDFNALATSMWYNHNQQIINDQLFGNIVIVAVDTAEEMRQL